MVTLFGVGMVVPEGTLALSVALNVTSTYAITTPALYADVIGTPNAHTRRSRPPTNINWSE